jgi:hypothetical protein
VASRREKKWILVLDSVDDDEFLREPRPGINRKGRREPLLDSLPATFPGTIIMTTRNRKVATGLVVNNNDLIEIKPMQQDEALFLIDRKLARSHRRKREQCIRS